MSDVSFLAGQSSLWILPDGPNTEPRYLGCHGMGDLTIPRGDVTLKYCPDPAHVGAYVVKNRFRGEPGTPTTSIETDMRKVADYLEEIGDCPVSLYLHKVSCGRRDVFSNFDRSFLLRNATITSEGLSNLAARSPDAEEESIMSFDLSADEVVRLFHLELARIATTNPTSVNNIAICGEDRCEGDCGPATKATDLMVAVTSYLSGSALSVGQVLISLNGAPWVATVEDPFSGGEDIQGVACFQMGRDTTRILVARGSNATPAGATVAYSDDYGSTAWTPVAVSAVDGEYVVKGTALFALDRYHIWLGTDGGRIYFSSDAGASWTLQEDAALKAVAIMGIHFVSPNVGYAVYTDGFVARTVNGSKSGAVWSLTGAQPAESGAMDIHACTPYFLWVVGTDGKHYSHDSGETWATRDAIPTAAIDFHHDLFGVAVGAYSIALAEYLVYYTINGGFDWTPMPLVANNGFFDVRIVSPSEIFVSGDVEGGVGFIGRISPAV